MNNVRMQYWLLLFLPVFRGEELAVRIKSDDRVAHIPVILLVKPGEDDRYIQRNADLYVWMPFAISSLKTEIAALIANREMIRKRYIRLALGVRPRALLIKR